MVGEPLGRAGVLHPAVLMARLPARVRNRTFEIDLLAAQVTLGAVACIRSSFERSSTSMYSSRSTLGVKDETDL